MTSSSSMTAKSYKNAKKVDEVKEVIQNKPDADIVKVLEFYDNDVAKTINAFMNGKFKRTFLCFWLRSLMFF